MEAEAQRARELEEKMRPKKPKVVNSPKSKRSIGRKEIKINIRGKSVSEIATSDGDISM